MLCSGQLLLFVVEGRLGFPASSGNAAARIGTLRPTGPAKLQPSLSLSFSLFV